MSAAFDGLWIRPSRCLVLFLLVKHPKTAQPSFKGREVCESVGGEWHERQITIVANDLKVKETPQKRKCSDRLQKHGRIGMGRREMFHCRDHQHRT